MSLLRQLVFGLTAAKFVLAVTAGNSISDDLLNRQTHGFDTYIRSLFNLSRYEVLLLCKRA